jgi:hypothetical protein
MFCYYFSKGQDILTIDQIMDMKKIITSKKNTFWYKVEKDSYEYTEYKILISKKFFTKKVKTPQKDKILILDRSNIGEYIDEGYSRIYDPLSVFGGIDATRIKNDRILGHSYSGQLVISNLKNIKIKKTKTFLKND